MRVLVTGAAGFVGQWVCSALLARGDDVTGTTLDAPPLGATGAPGELSGVRWQRVDLRDRETVNSVLETARPDLVVHLAGVTFVPTATADPGQAYEVNVVGAARLLGAMAERKRSGALDPTVVLVGSGEEYGRHDEDWPLTESAALRPLSVYGATKVGQETAGLQTWRETALRVVCTRSFNHTGPGQADHLLVPALVRRALALRGSVAPRLPIGNTTPVRDFLHVSDVVDAYLLLAERGTPGEVYNVASGVGRSVGELAALVLDRAGVAAPLEPVPEFMRPVDLPVLVGDSTKLRKATGWRPRLGIEQAIDELIHAAAR